MLRRRMSTAAAQGVIERGGAVVGSPVHELTNVEIDKYYRNDTGYGGCMSKDQLDATEAAGHFTILNMQDSNAGNGTHWVLLDDTNPHLLVYFDSMGAPPPKKVSAFVRKRVDATGKSFVYNPVQLQQMGSSVCGYWCILAHYELKQHDHDAFKVFLQSLEHTTPAENDHLIQQLVASTRIS